MVSLGLADLGRLDERILSDDLLSQPMDVIRVINTERSLYDRQLNDKLYTRRTAQAEICAGCNGQTRAQFRSREKAGEALGTRRARSVQRGGIEFQPAAFRDAARATVEEESGLEVLLHDRDAVFHV